MAMSDMREFPPRREWIEQLEQVDPRPAIEIVVDDHVLFSIDPESEELVGLQLDGFLAYIVYELPSFLTIADDIGLSSHEVEQIRQKVAPEARTRSVLEAFLGHIEPLAAVS